MKLPILALLPDGRVRVYEQVERILGELRPDDISQDRHRFYNGQGFKLRYQLEVVLGQRRILGIFPVSARLPRLTLLHYDPPLDRRAEIEAALRDYLSWPGFLFPPRWLETAPFDELVNQARQLLW